ncbi:choice-of-anchor L domain-containing protein [Frigoriflavimonas asaccharolytica]|nr:choice-of-anchor L domain-containing protein [Frigoriflavimonas asaccharolytica]
MKNYYLIFFALFFSQNLFSQDRKVPLNEKISAAAKAGQYIDVNVPPYPASTFTPTQLVTDVLIGVQNTCAAPNISNVSVSPNQSVSNNDRFWGYFNKTTSTFPFNEGIILTSGIARRGGNGPLGNLSDGNGGGSDPDLLAATGVTASIIDAGVLEFDFIPSSTQLTFRYLFASEEYEGSFMCPPLPYDDAFALLLKPNTPGSTYSNLAVLPGGLGPVAVSNIVGTQFSCPTNQQFFGGTTLNGTNYNGITIPLTATATVIPGQSYHIKMVIADVRDGSYDSAVFIEAGSFDIGVQILDPAGVALPPTIQVCNNTPTVLAPSVQVPNSVYQWFLNGVAIPGATSAAYTALVPGIYTIEVLIPGNTCPGSAQVEIIGGTSPTVNNVTFTACYGPGDVTFNLPLIASAVSSAPGAVYRYYLNQADAVAANGNFIADPTTFQSAGGQTVFVSVNNSFCPAVAFINLVKAPEMVAVIENPQPINCANPTRTLIGNASTYPVGSTFLWQASNGGTIVSGGNTLNAVVSTGGTYSLTIVKTYQPGEVACTAVKTVNVIVDTAPPLVAVTAPKTTICLGESITLTASGGANYQWSGSLVIANTLTVAPLVTTTYTVYSFGANGCKSTNPATITIEVVPAITSTLPSISGYICAGDVITLDAGVGANYSYLWSTGETTQTISTGVAGVYTVTISNGICSKNFSTSVIEAIVPQVVDVLFENGILTITASNPSNGLLEYSLDDGFTWQNSNVFTNVLPNSDILIKVRVKTTTCVGSLRFFTFMMLNVLTPNGDGLNDQIDLSGISKYPNFGASIFDRYGKEIFKMDKNIFIWDGKFQSRPLPTATYWFQLQYEHPASKKLIQNNGWILIKNRD